MEANNGVSKRECLPIDLFLVNCGGFIIGCGCEVVFVQGGGSEALVVTSCRCERFCPLRCAHSFHIRADISEKRVGLLSPQYRLAVVVAALDVYECMFHENHAMVTE
jgi:hypothetical protein